MAIFQPVAVVLPHHNLVQSVRQKFLKNIASNRPLTRHIVLISPDHFSANQKQITSSTRNWNLSTGTAHYNNFLKLNLPQNDQLLKDDHGIYNPLADLKTYFPSADFYPILIGQKTTSADLKLVLDALKNHCHSDCLLVSSVDFSHYLPVTLANVHDAFTLNNLQNLDTTKILQSEVDSPQSLYLLTSFAQSKNAYHWSLFDHTNSGLIFKNPDTETTSHIFGSYSLGLLKKYSVTTSTSIPVPLIRSQNQSTLGDRFFYGVDKFSVDSNTKFVVSTITTPQKIIKSFLPIKNILFILGSEKVNLIKTHFDSLPNSKSLTKDYFWGTLIYERN